MPLIPQTVHQGDKNTILKHAKYQLEIALIKVVIKEVFLHRLNVFNAKFIKLLVLGVIC